MPIMYVVCLTKFVNTNNHTHHFWHGVVILGDAKITVSKKKYLKPDGKITFCRVDKKG